MAKFEKNLCGLLAERDVKAVYVQLPYTDDHGEPIPVTDTVLVVGEIERSRLNHLVKELLPDEVGERIDKSGICDDIFERYPNERVSIIWWD